MAGFEYEVKKYIIYSIAPRILPGQGCWEGALPRFARQEGKWFLGALEAPFGVSVGRLWEVLVNLGAKRLKKKRLPELPPTLGSPKV